MYRYTLCDRPLGRCPGCGGTLTEFGDVDLTLSVGGHVFSVGSYLDEDGVLTDTEDEAVACGYHSLTSCGHCATPLTDHEGVEEDSEYLN